MAITVSLSQWDKLLQDDYVTGEIVAAINTATPFKEKLERKAMVGGRQRLYPVKVGASQGTGARAEGSTSLPGYGAGDYVNATVTSRYNYALFKITGQSLEFPSRAAFVEFGMQILKDTKESLALSVQRQSWSDGSGKLALANGAQVAGTTVIPVDSPYGVAWGAAAAVTTFLFRKNMVIQFGASQTNAGAGYTITAVGATSITITPGIEVGGIADNVAVYLLGSKDNEIEGWLKISATAAQMTSATELNLGTSVYHNIDRAVNPEFEGNVIDAGAALSLTNIRTAKDALFTRCGHEAELCINSTQVTRDFEALLQANQRYVPAVKLEGGYTSLEHDGLRFVKDKDAPVRAFNLVSPSYIAWAQTGDPHWHKQGDAVMRAVAGSDAYEGMLKWYANLDCPEPRRQLIMKNLTVAA